ncbi:unnamed protein product [Caenorhabditis bovis]|uniref:Uncharacterized protein n=1 Tax=Caenorhabditis bovis TaxID=2654633 RepID=A0A8S1EIS7_9PELO|nr:unnamed protein product [Caenorhabditis bovis]
MLNCCAIALLAIIQVFANVQAVTECGLPSNLNTLPDFAQEEVREIWRNYQSGSPCEREIQIQKDIFDVVKSIEEDPSPNNSHSKTTTQSPANIDYDHIAANGGEPIPLLSATSAAPLTSTSVIIDTVDEKNGIKTRSISDDTDDYLDQTTFDDVAMLQFDNVNAPFLRTAPHYVKNEFSKVWQDQNIPSESLRALKIQTLAVSLLNSQQLGEYNRWASKRRRVLKAREQEMRNLSFEAKRTLRRMSNYKEREEVDPIIVSPEVKRELTSFVQKLNRRRSLKLVH